MNRDLLHSSFCKKNKQLCDWYSEKATKLTLPIYSSYDIRDSGLKITNVDANIYPAGFNNICPVDQESAPELFRSYLEKHYGLNIKKILLITEEHTQNPFYWDNISTIGKLLGNAGLEVKVAFPSRLEKSLQITSARGDVVSVESGFGDAKVFTEFQPDLIISNNDFSNAHEEWAKSVTTPINPPRELGWYQRSKYRYFKHYNQLAKEFADVAGFDPFIFSVKTELFENFDMEDEVQKKKLSQRVDGFISELKKEYLAKGITQDPFVFVKNDAGTYGLAVIRVQSGADILALNYKSRKKMKAAKGGRDVEDVIIQEGIPSRVQSEGASAEPVIYMVGEDLAGGFLRTHGEKSSTESLNSPGAVYKKLCVSDLNVSLEGSPLENVYGWSAKLGLLAIGLEAQEMNVNATGYK